MADFHFLRPWWLALLPIALWVAWRSLRGRADGAGWSAIVDPALRAHVLAAPQLMRESRWPLVAALALCTLAILALAGPAWERLPVPAFRSDEALVVALDLSRSMDAADVAPSRLARAKLKLLDLLERRAAGQTALVVFTTHAFTVTPLTTDVRTIASLVTALDSGIMPSQGSSLAAGLTKAAALLAQTGLSNGTILLITDAEAGERDEDVANELADDGYVVHVLGVGTEQGAPIAQPGGGFLTDSNGLVVVPRLQPGALQAVAAAGDGRYAQLAPDDRDLDALFPPESVLDAGAALARAAEQEEYEADVWRDQGVWFAVALLPLLALGFRRGWIGVWLLAFALAAPAPPAAAFEWQDLWLRRDQRGYEALQAEQAARAAELFADPEWRSAAQYRAGEFPESAALLEGIDTAQGHYNRGNALAKAGRLEPAIAAYDAVLEIDPEHADALYNRELLQEFLENNPQAREQNRQPSGGDQGADEEQQQQEGQASSDDGEGEQGSGDPQDGQERDPSQQASAGDSQGDGSEDQQDPSEGEGEDGSEQQAQNEEQQEQGDSAQQASAAEDVEQWASEQAAEQWLRRIPQDPGGLLRRKFLYQYQRLGVDQEGNSVWPGEAAQPW